MATKNNDLFIVVIVALCAVAVMAVTGIVYANVTGYTDFSGPERAPVTSVQKEQRPASHDRAFVAANNCNELNGGDRADVPGCGS